MVIAIQGVRSSKKGKGPEFLRFCRPIIDELRGRGGSGTASEVIDAVIERLKIPETEQKATLKNGTSRLANQVAWARFYLVRGGYIDSSERGVWTLSDKGTKSDLSDDQVLKLFKEVHDEIDRLREIRTSEDRSVEPSDEESPSVGPTPDHRASLLSLLLELPPSGFERLCQRVLREAGFEQVIVTGRSGDGGIDGHGVLQLNPFVTFKVMFQCKRYRGSVGASQVRDFRGAMMGRAEKGIILTTGAFTVDALREARRDGVPPIELVDGTKLIEMFENLHLGLRPKKAYEIDLGFFEPFRALDE